MRSVRTRSKAWEGQSIVDNCAAKSRAAGFVTCSVLTPSLELEVQFPRPTLKKKKTLRSSGALPSNGELWYWSTGLWLGITRSCMWGSEQGVRVCK
jgi:hypothetical protein